MVYSFIRLAGAVLGVAAIIRQLVQSVGHALASETVYGGHVPTVVANFFSFFTIQSNVLAATTLTIGAVWMWTRGRHAEEEPRWFAVLLACATTYMIITGIVYNLLLRGYALEGVTVPWSNEVLHVVIPLVMLLDLFVAPKRRGLPWGAVWVIIAYPIVWVVYTLIRANLITGPVTGDPWWYPYPFLDPHLEPNGYVGVAGWVAIISATFVAIGLLVVWVGRRRAARRTSRRLEAATLRP